MKLPAVLPIIAGLTATPLLTGALGALCLVTVSATALAAPSTSPSSYTPEQLRLSARAFLATQDRGLAPSLDVKLAAAEFRGAVLGFLDGALEGDVWDKDLDKCVRSADLDSVTRETAQRLAGGTLWRDVPGRFQIGITVRLACEALTKGTK